LLILKNKGFCNVFVLFNIVERMKMSSSKKRMYENVQIIGIIIFKV